MGSGETFDIVICSSTDKGKNRSSTPKVVGGGGGGQTFDIVIYGG